MKEIRALPVTLEARATGNDGEQRTITGHIDYGISSVVLTDRWGDRFIEELAPGCFDESLKTRQVVALWSHDTGQVLGSTGSQTLRITSDISRLSFDLDLPDTQAGQDAQTLIQRGDVTGLSFGMVVKADKWSDVDQDGEKIYKRTIIEADLYEISPVVFPAYPSAGIACRSLEEHIKKLEEDLGMNETPNNEVIQTTEANNEEERSMNNTEQTEVRTVPAVAITATADAREERAAFNHYLRTGELRAMGVSSATKGAALAPVDFAKEIIDGLNDDVVMRQLARILPPISGKSAAYPRRTGGSGAAMSLEGAPIVPYDLTFDQVVLTPKKAACLVEVSNELLQDEGVDLAGYLAQHFRDEIGELLEGQYWNGDATDANLQGILTAESAPGVKAITRIPAKAADIRLTDILELWAALSAKYRANATWVCSSKMEAEICGLIDANGRPIVLENLADPTKRYLLGRPLVIADEFPGTLEAGTDALMVGDFQKAVYIADKAGIDIQRNDAIGFNKDVTAFRATFRTDIALVLPEAIKILSVKAS